jgi:hypothetical protein
MEEEEYSYFSADRLVGVLGIRYFDDESWQAEVIELIHLTSRFGAFIRKGEKWDPLWQGWNPNPDYKYINFDASSYSKILRIFDNKHIDFLSYEEVSEFQEILNWEGGFDETEEPECFRDIEELVNWIQDFIKPQPAVITYGDENISISDMAWMRQDVEELERLQEETESYVLAQRRKRSSEIMDEKLFIIQMYPPLSDAVLDAFSQAGTSAAFVDCLDEFDAEMRGTPVQKFLFGGSASMRELNAYYLDLLAISIDYQQPLKQEDADKFSLTRAKELKPQNRLEIWFYGKDGSFSYDVIANTEFGLFSRSGGRKWLPFIRNPEVEDLIDLAGCSIVHIRPEREKHLLDDFDSGALKSIRINSPILKKYSVDYGDKDSTSSDCKDRKPLNQGPKISYSDLTRIAALLVQDVSFSLWQDLRELKMAGFDVSDAEARHLELESFRRLKKQLSLLDLHKHLVECLGENSEGESISSSAGDLRQAIKKKATIEKLMEVRDIEYFQIDSLVLALPFSPRNVMWLEYQSKNYGNFVRQSGEWVIGLSDYQKEFQEVGLYRIKEECVQEIIVLFDELEIAKREVSIEEIAPMLYTPRMLNRINVDESDPNAWDAGLFTRDEMPPSLTSVVEYIYESVMRRIVKYSESLETDEAEVAMQVDQWMSRLGGERMIDFMNREESMNRNLLREFITEARKI